MTILTVTVTEEDKLTANRKLAEGQERCKCCILAEAIKREHPQYEVASIRYTSGYVVERAPWQGRGITLGISGEARQIIDAFDENLPLPLPQTVKFTLLEDRT